MIDEKGDPTPERGALWRIAGRLLVVLVIAWGAHLALNWANGLVDSGGLAMRVGMLSVFLLVYAILIAIPFLPGIEIGMALMAIEGSWIAPLIYVATLGGLTLAFAAGEWMPYERLYQIFKDLRMRRVCVLLKTVQPLDRQTRLDLLRDRAPRLLRPLVSRFRYVVLAILVNLPGNSIIGGGGGILFIAGFSRLFRPLATIVTLALAVAPVPLLVWAFEINVQDWFR
ncbi:hypothetical protein [Primorskyibacter sp. 2E233]|uniref:hypothetical protein n=1 Tax=Primorskyibacter sp. 2E233 TaxID=3413431 RepID=UPI003BF22711